MHHKRNCSDGANFFDQFDVGPKAQAQKEKEAIESADATELSEARAVLRLVNMRRKFYSDPDECPEECHDNTCFFHQATIELVPPCTAIKVLYLHPIEGPCLVEGDATVLPRPTPGCGCTPPPALDRYVWVGPDLRMTSGQGKLYRVQVTNKCVAQRLTKAIA